MHLGVIGCGKMGSALIQGAINAQILQANTVFGYDKITAAAESFAATTGATICSSLDELSHSCDTFLLATKPYDVPAVLKNLAASRADPRFSDFHRRWHHPRLARIFSAKIHPRHSHHAQYTRTRWQGCLRIYCR